MKNSECRIGRRDFLKSCGVGVGLILSPCSKVALTKKRSAILVHWPYCDCNQTQVGEFTDFERCFTENPNYITCPQCKLKYEAFKEQFDEDEEQPFKLNKTLETNRGLDKPEYSGIMMIINHPELGDSTLRGYEQTSGLGLQGDWEGSMRVDFQHKKLLTHGGYISFRECYGYRFVRLKVHGIGVSKDIVDLGISDEEFSEDYLLESMDESRKYVVNPIPKYSIPIDKQEDFDFDEQEIIDTLSGPVDMSMVCGNFPIAGVEQIKRMRLSGEIQ